MICDPIFLSEGVETCEIYERMTLQYKNNCMIQRKRCIKIQRRAYVC